MTRYTLLFHNEDYVQADLDGAQREAIFREFVVWIDGLAERGVYAGSDALAQHEAARTVRKRGETVAIDGPFAETHEAINGFVNVFAASLDEALQLAAGCPGLAHGMAVEVRELMEIAKPVNRVG